uniref:CAP-Gly domain-containing protein n=1 Tax=Macrostomum lignano TaxID=282301 RepID=A0A1I8HXW2_9PLAT
EGQKTPSKPPSVVDEGQKTPSKPPSVVDEGQKTPSKPPSVVDEGQKTSSKPPSVVDEGQKTPSKPPSVVDEESIVAEIAADLEAQVLNLSDANQSLRANPDYSGPPPPPPPAWEPPSDARLQATVDELVVENRVLRNELNRLRHRGHDQCAHLQVELDELRRELELTRIRSDELQRENLRLKDEVNLQRTFLSGLTSHRSDYDPPLTPRIRAGHRQPSYRILEPPPMPPPPPLSTLGRRRRLDLDDIESDDVASLAEDPQPRRTTPGRRNNRRRPPRTDFDDDVDEAVYDILGRNDDRDVDATASSPLPPPVQPRRPVWSSTVPPSLSQAPPAHQQRQPRTFAPRSESDLHQGDLSGRLTRGRVRYVGSLHGRQGTYVGVELADGLAGKHDGVFDGRRYFQCKQNQGTFVTFDKIALCHATL